MRNISFALTTEAVRERRKTVTRRLGWLFLKRGDLLQPVVKGQGIKKGEHVEKIGGPIMVESVRSERLNRMLDRRQRHTYGIDECIREGFPELTPEQFALMFIEHNRDCDLNTPLTRIEFSYVDADAADAASD